MHMKRLLLTTLSLVVLSGVLAQKLKKADKAIVENLKGHIGILADDALEGRRAGTEGERKAMDYIAGEFSKLGLQPKGENGGFISRALVLDQERVDSLAALARGFEATLPQALDWMDATERRLPDLPLQVTAATLRHGQDYLAWQLGQGGLSGRDGEIGGDGDGEARAQVVFSLPDETVLVHSLIAPRDADARALLRALATAYPDRRVRVPQLQREDLGGAALRALGAAPQPLHQQLMVRAL